uniref:Pyruvate dehydrogenase E1 component subunit beta n=1 Tax=Solanum lycopersicum TaxID=4081 RepID=A0A3Q7FMY7_SOLLC
MGRNNEAEGFWPLAFWSSALPGKDVNLQLYLSTLRSLKSRGLSEEFDSYKEADMSGIINRKMATRGISALNMNQFLLGSRVFASRNFSSATKEMTVRDALNSALDEEMSADPKVFIMGEEVGEYQGAYKITKGLLNKYGPQRVLDTPITEAGFTGMGVGAAYHGLKPVIEFMTFNFSMQAIDHIINSAAKSNYMSAGQIAVPIVFRGPNGAAAGVGAQHSQELSTTSKFHQHCHIVKSNNASFIALIPKRKGSQHLRDFRPSTYLGLTLGAKYKELEIWNWSGGKGGEEAGCDPWWWEVLAPYSSEDARGLLKAAIRDPDPVVFLENELLYGESFPVSAEVLDSSFALPIGKAKASSCFLSLLLCIFYILLLFLTLQAFAD